jgi:hypothetical protein
MADHQDSKAPTTIVMAKVPKFEISPAASAYGVHDIELVALDELPSEPETPRSKLRLFAILTGIYVSPPLPNPPSPSTSTTKLPSN